MINKYKFSIVVSLLSFLGFSQSYLDGIFVLNEGNMGSNAASVSFISANNQVTNNIYGISNNNNPLGDVGQSIGFYGDIAMVVLNFSNSVKVVNRETFVSVTSIEAGLTNPRYVEFYQNKAYVTCWGDGTVTTDDYLAVINLTTYQVESTIPMPEGVEKIEEVNGKLYVAHQGGYGYGTTISVVNPVTSSIEATINVGDVPNAMVVKGNYLYVLSGGMPSWSSNGETAGKLHKIDLGTNAVVSEFTFSGVQHPLHLSSDANYLYYTIDANVYRMAFTDLTLPTSAYITTPVTDFLGIYGLDVIDGKIYIADANGYAAQGFAHLYNADGTFLTTHALGNIPNHFYKSNTSNLGGNDLTEVVFKVYPNPAVTTVFIATDKDVNVVIYDLSGKKVKEELYTLSGIDVSGLQAGIYMMEIRNENQKQTVKLAIK
ncbi:T9SS type A sorting domain-containing protein [Flavobacterium enshiense]|uniref:T9SS type A sorting domain-containing protein n=1 Tax=Flavobacterium enshiense TaxID=1341165 RepID=UPI00345C9007